ncbi:unnamed protein product [Moneuplotes crassus]|uniref:Uncharacterized protein n=1 Tax=Euplotes crassus TaxID=5936 RepID=A0AAD1Y9D0_EUPCR|nr:unnamed protein product [Moneuplotes crassus]
MTEVESDSVSEHVQDDYYKAYLEELEPSSKQYNFAVQRLTRETKRNTRVENINLDFEDFQDSDGLCPNEISFSSSCSETLSDKTSKPQSPSPQKKLKKKVLKKSKRLPSNFTSKFIQNISTMSSKLLKSKVQKHKKQKKLLDYQQKFWLNESAKISSKKRATSRKSSKKSNVNKSIGMSFKMPRRETRRCTIDLQSRLRVEVRGAKDVTKNGNLSQTPLSHTSKFKSRKSYEIGQINLIKTLKPHKPRKNPKLHKYSKTLGQKSRLAYPKMPKKKLSSTRSFNTAKFIQASFKLGSKPSSKARITSPSSEKAISRIGYPNLKGFKKSKNSTSCKNSKQEGVEKVTQASDYTIKSQGLSQKDQNISNFTNACSDLDGPFNSYMAVTRKALRNLNKNRGLYQMSPLLL